MPYAEAQLEADIRARGLTAPRVTPEMVDAEIVDEQFHQFPGTTVTACCLTLRNGFNTIGYSAAASPENFDAEIGRRVARDNARQKIWSLLGFRVKDLLHEGRQTR